MTRRTYIILLLLLVSLIVPTFLFAQYAPNYSSREQRIGVAFGVPNGAALYRPGAAEIKFGYDFTDGNQYVYLATDYRIINSRQIAGILYGTFGVGLYGKLYPEGRDNEGENVEVDWGTRIPIGLSIKVLQGFLEAFIEVAPGIDLYPRATVADQPVQFFAGIALRIN